MRIRNDPFVKGMMERIPENERECFTDSQLMSLKVAFSASRPWGVHPVDLRWTFSLLGKQYYCVFIAGIKHRTLSRNQREITLMGKSLLLTGALAFSSLLGALILYLLKSASGINIFTGFSFGIWDSFKGMFH